MKTAFFAMMIVAVPLCVFAADGQVLINQATVMAAGGFPYRITQSGSYKLSGNLTVADKYTTAIVIASDYVSIDFNGFGIIGPGVYVGIGGGTGVDGSEHSSISLSNGTVRWMGGIGIILGPRSTVQNMNVSSNGYWGIKAVGIVKDNTVGYNRNDGILALGVVSGNFVQANTISVYCPSFVTGNVISQSANLENISTDGNLGCLLVNNTAH